MLMRDNYSVVVAYLPTAGGQEGGSRTLNEASAIERALI